MKGRSKKYYRKIFRAYPDMVTLLQFREMLGGVSDNFARKLIHEKHVKSIFIKPHYYISKNSVVAGLWFAVISSSGISFWQRPRETQALSRRKNLQSFRMPDIWACMAE